MVQREIIMQVQKEQLLAPQKTVGYAGEHLATLLRFELPESWIADQSLQYYVSYYVESNQKGYRTADMSWPVEAILPQVLMVEGVLDIQLNVVTYQDGVVRRMKSAVCKMTVDKSVEDNGQKVDDEMVGLVESSLLEIKQLTDEVNAVLAEFRTDIARLDNLVANAGDVAGNAELLDIRVGADGTSYDTAGNAVRSIAGDLSTLSGQLRDYIDKKAIDGLLVEENLLYLTSDGEIASDPVELPAGGGGGGGGSSSVVRLANENGESSLSAAAGEPVLLRYRFSSMEDGTPTGNGTAQIYINGILKATQNIAQGSNSFDCGGLCAEGTNTVKITCTDVYGVSRSLTYTVTIVALSISSTFDDSAVYDGEITFKFTPVGAIEKTIHFVMDGEELSTQVITSTGKQATRMLPAMSHGVHTLKVYATAVLGGVEVSSNALLYDVMCVEAGNNTPMIASAWDAQAATQGELLNIPFSVYDPVNLTAEVTLTVTYMDGDTQKVYETSTRTVDRTRQLWNTRNYPAGSVTFTIAYGAISKRHTITVAENIIPVEAATHDLELHLSAAGRSNSESNPAVWSYGDTTTSFDKVNWNTNGWIPDDNGDTALRLSGGATASIQFRPFKDDFRTTGKTLEFEFAVHDVNNRDAVVISCLDGGMGLKVTADSATLISEQTAVGCRYRDGKKLRVAFVVEAASEYRMMSVYLNGVLSGAKQYPANDNFTQASPAIVVIGSPLCGVDVYTVRSYSTALTAEEVRDNYIADLTDSGLKAKQYAANNIYNDYGNLSFSAVSERIPVMTITGPLPQSKGDKKTVSVSYADPFHPDFSFDDTCTIDVQGTSSQWYVRKNYKLKFAQEHQHAEGQMPAKVFCMKADYAEATGTHNTQNANLVHTLYTEKTPAQEADSRARTTVYGFPCVIFHRENEAGDPVFIGKYNFNFDKGAENVFGFTQAYPAVECWEVCNNTSERCLFQNDDLSADPESDFEGRYPDGNNNYSNLQKMLTWVVSTCQEQATGSALAEPFTDYQGVQHTVDNAGYRLAKFRTEFSDHFDLHYSLIYYVYTFVMLMVDQRAKNMMLTTWDGDIWQPWFYDNDTCLGINNEGQLVFDYFHEDIDQLDGANVYNGQNSTLWVNFRQAFADEIRELYQTLRSSGKLTYERIHAYFVENGSDKWSASVYNEDAFYKYIEMLHTDGDATNLPQIRGTGQEHLEYFLDNRLMYCDSKWYAADYANDYLSLRIYTPSEYAGVTPNANITVTPYSDLYAGVRYKANGALQQQRTRKNQPITFTAPAETFNDTETAIYGASELSSLGDLSPLYCGSIDVSKAGKLTELIVGSAVKGYSNGNLKSLSVGTNKLLRKIDVQNCPNLTAPLALANCPNIEEIYANGSGITGVELAQSGYLKVLKLPATVTNLTIRNQRYLETFEMDSYANIKTLWIENSTGVPLGEIVPAATALSRVRLTNVDWTLEDSSLIERLMECGGLDEAGRNIEKSVLTGKVHIKTIAPTIMSTIQAYFPNLTVTYDAFEREYTVTFVNWDDSVLDVQKVPNGQPAKDPISRDGDPIPVPTRPADAQFIYTFSSWNSDFSAIYSDRTIRATYTGAIRSYTVRFYNGNELLQTVSNVDYGTNAKFAGTAPVYTGSEQGDFLFVGWAPSPMTIVGDTDCIAQFELMQMPEKHISFGECSLAQMMAICKAGYASAFWDIGDERDITLTSGETLTFQIYDFDHDELSEKEGTASITLGMKNLMKEKKRIHEDILSVPSVGWSNSELFAWMQSEGFNLLPIEYRSIVQPVNKIAREENGSSSTKTSVNKLFLLGWSETNFSHSSLNPPDGHQYPIFTDNNSRKKSLSNGTGSYDAWWVRSVSYAQNLSRTNGAISSGGSNSYEYVGKNIGVCFGFCIGDTPQKAKLPISQFSWSELAEMSASKWKMKMLEIGSTKDIVLTTGEVLTVQLYDILHDDLTDGSGKAGLTFGLRNLMSTQKRMCSNSSIADNWETCEMRTFLSQVYEEMPDEIKSLIKEVNKATFTIDGTKKVQITADKLFLFSSHEVNMSVYSSEAENAVCSIYPVFTDYESRIKKLSNGTGDAKSWWLRSPRSSISNAYCCITFNGYGGNDGSGNSGNNYGVCFGFCI